MACRELKDFIRPLRLSAALFFVASAAALSQTPEELKELYCPSLGDAAETVMGMRQNGQPREDLLAFASEDELFEVMILEMVEYAYAIPQMLTPEEAMEAVLKFRAIYEDRCFNFPTMEPWQFEHLRAWALN